MIVKIITSIPDILQEVLSDAMIIHCRAGRSRYVSAPTAKAAEPDNAARRGKMRGD